MASFLETKKHASSTIYSPTEAFFLGGMLSCSDEHNGDDLVSLVRHNRNFVDPSLLSQHRKLIADIAQRVGGRVTDLEDGRFDGFAAHFSAPYDDPNTLLERAESIAEKGDDAIIAGFLAGFFDGRSSFDRKKGSQGSVLFVIDCPRANGAQIADLVSGLAMRFNIGIHPNTHRDRPEGGDPRKNQLRLSPQDASYFFEEIGLFSPEKLQRACDEYGFRGSIEADPINLPGLKVLR